MKLQPALIFGESAVLQRRQPIPVWGRSVGSDTVTVTLGEQSQTTVAEDGCWRVTFPPMEAADRITMTISSAKTGERLVFGHLAVGEVWLAGGQSNMEFLFKYDAQAEEMVATEDDPLLRYFRYPQAAFLGQLERDPFPDDGFWRSWECREDRGMFSGPSAYMGRELRRVLGVPVGFIGCNWGGTPAAAWTSMEALEANPALKPVLDWHNEACAALDWAKYEADALQPPAPTPPEQAAILDRLMMGEDPRELFKLMPPRPRVPVGYSAFSPGPKAAIRPAGLYEYMLRQVHPYAICGAIWYQGEDDDARGWQDFYAAAMKTLICCWRKLWGWELPFLQVELAPFEGMMPGQGLHYPVIRTQQRLAADSLPGVYDVCIMDAGDRRNIHARRKRPVGERLALLARKYVYGETELLADSPCLCEAKREGDTVTLRFTAAGEGLTIRGPLPLQATADGAQITPGTAAEGDTLTLRHEAFAGAAGIEIRYAEENYCEATLYNSAGLPAFPFTAALYYV